MITPSPEDLDNRIMAPLRTIEARRAAIPTNATRNAEVFWKPIPQFSHNSKEDGLKDVGVSFDHLKAWFQVGSYHIFTLLRYNDTGSEVLRPAPIYLGFHILQAHNR